VRTSKVIVGVDFFVHRSYLFTEGPLLLLQLVHEYCQSTDGQFEQIFGLGTVALVLVEAEINDIKQLLGVMGRELSSIVSSHDIFGNKERVIS